MQSASMPSCSTVWLAKPSRPTQCEEKSPGAVLPGVTAQFMNGTKKVALTLRNVTPLRCTAYPPQLWENTVSIMAAALVPAGPPGSGAGIIGCGAGLAVAGLAVAGLAVAGLAAARCAIVRAAAYGALKAAADAAIVTAATAVPV